LAATLELAMGRIAGFIEREQHFTRDASHELRTPLTVIDGAAQLLARQQLPPQAAAQVQRIQSASMHMAQTVNTLLALAREEGEASAPQAVALLPVIEKAVVTFAHLLEGKPVEVMVDVGPADKVNAHEAVLAILLGNLVSNAFAHTSCGVIRISLCGRSVTVEDSGPGIAPALKGRLYQSGVKGEGSAGFGLGLSIASRLAARYGIALSIDDGVQGGCRATLGFPE
ncbi:MAG: HAMP domain-containing sensor histidine kinase, partial [Telluria sp.]